jgi:hypothetical protein
MLMSTSLFISGIYTFMVDSEVCTGNISIHLRGFLSLIWYRGWTKYWKHYRYLLYTGKIIEGCGARTEFYGPPLTYIHTYTQTRTHTVLYEHGVGPPFAFSTPAVLLGMTCTNFEQSVAELYIILHEEHLQVALEMLELGICSSL